MNGLELLAFEPAIKASNLLTKHARTITLLRKAFEQSKVAQLRRVARRSFELNKIF